MTRELEPKKEREAGSRHFFISVMGVTGVGKTTVARELAPALGCEIFDEETATHSNPFLGLAYGNPQKWGFDSQVHFLLSKILSLQRLKLILPERPVLAEPHFDEDTDVYAPALLKGEALERYQTVAKSIRQAKVCPEPDLIVFVKARVDKVIERIRHRAEKEGGVRERELLAPREYWSTLSQLNHEWVKQTKIPVVTLDTNDLNIADKPEHARQAIEFLLGRILEELWEMRGGIALDHSSLISPASLSR